MKIEDVNINTVYYYEQKTRTGWFKALVKVIDKSQFDLLVDVEVFLKNPEGWVDKGIFLQAECALYPATKETHPEFFL